MKKTLLLLFTFFSFSAAMAQGNNLQFSEVKYLPFSHSTNTSHEQSNVGSITIPSNKVWKITSVSAHSVYSNGQRIDAAFFKVHIADIFVESSDFPIWLPTGTYTVFFDHDSNVSTYQGTTSKCTISAIEFNLVQ